MKKEKGMKNAGYDVPKPSKSCSDRNCPWHGFLRTRGRTFVAKVVTLHNPSTPIVEWEHTKFIPKFERSERRKTRVSAHKPGCIDVGVGSSVFIAECRPLSKTKNFVIVSVIEEQR